ncbi:MAG: hypothetical protein KJ067_15525 [Vicinamibacteria bacterium]|nr:hypothetical protein [Vicinamibacteria bacterium]
MQCSRRIVSSWPAFVLCALSWSCLAIAQETAFAPGQKVLAGTGSARQEGVVVRQDASGVLVRFPMWDGRDDPVNGPTRHYRPDELRLAGAAPAAPATAVPRARRVRVVPSTDGAPLSQAEILTFLKGRIGSDPWAHPDKPAVVRELAALIRARGVDFRWDTLSAFANELRNSGGNETTIPFHIRANFGSPVAQEWFYGAWDLSKYARSLSQQGDRWVERDTVALNGTLQIGADGSYAWDSASGAIRGRWRPAVASEMEWRQAGGAGIVLLRGKSGADWLVKEWDPEPLAVESISITLLESEATQEFGGRRGSRR